MAKNRNSQASQAPDQGNAPEGAAVQDIAPAAGDQAVNPSQDPTPQDAEARQNNPEQNSSASQQKAGDQGGTDTGELYSVRHKTIYPAYRRAGLVIRRQPEEFPLTEEQVKVLSADKWVEIKKVGKKEK